MQDDPLTRSQNAVETGSLFDQGTITVPSERSQCEVIPRPAGFDLDAQAAAKVAAWAAPEGGEGEHEHAQTSPSGRTVPPASAARRSRSEASEL